MANSLVTAGEWEFASPPRDPEKKPMEQKKDERVVMYHAGEDGTPQAREFASAADIPKGEGWVDHPDKVKAHKGKPFQKKHKDDEDADA